MGANISADGRFDLYRERSEAQLWQHYGPLYISSGFSTVSLPGEPGVSFGMDLIQTSAELMRLLMAVDLAPQGEVLQALATQACTVHTLNITSPRIDNQLLPACSIFALAACSRRATGDGYACPGSLKQAAQRSLQAPIGGVLHR